MNPHRLAYGFAHDMPFAQITALTLFVSIIFSKEKKRIPVDGLILVWLLFVLFMGITTIFAYFPEYAFEQYSRIFKIQLIVFLTIILIAEMKKIEYLIWIIVLSIGYYSAKGGLFTIMTAGAYRVWGPESSFIEDNNSLAVATLMVIPLMAFLHRITISQSIKFFLMLMMIFSAFSVIGSNSRGAFLAIGALGFSYFIKSNNKLFTSLILIIMAVLLLSFAPESWFKRMDTIKGYEEDSSALGRLNAWEYAFNAANDNLLGVGLESWSPQTFALYAPDPQDVHAAHSIYFSVLADHGWFGLLLFLTIHLLNWRRLGALIKNTAQVKEFERINYLARMLQVSLTAYLVGGAFLSLSYYDLPWHIISFTLILERILDTKEESMSNHRIRSS
jgi:probable O-glycosylation ligase (exosortase A-associated)